MNKKLSLGVAIALMAIVAATTFSITMVYSTRTFNDKVHSIKEREAMYSKIAEIDRLVRQNYFGDIDESKLGDEIATGYVKGIQDKYGMYFTAEQYSQQMQTYDGKMAGIGISTYKDTSGYIRIIEVYPDSAAETADLQVGDLIVKVEDLDVTAENYDQAVNALKGEAGTKVNITIRRNAQDSQRDVTRRRVEVPTVNHRMIGEVGYIKIKEFNNNTASQFKKAINKVTDEGAKALIFDVRNNLGGTLNSVNEMLDLLLPEGDIVSATYKNGETKVLATSDAKEISLPMVVLVNQRSASASELFAQALKDYDKAKVVGVTSYGKGMMQTIYQLSDGSALDVTVAKYNPPKSPNFDKVGVKPDHEVALTPEQEKNFIDLDETTDPQLKKALEVAYASIKGVDASTVIGASSQSSSSESSSSLEDDEDNSSGSDDEDSSSSGSEDEDNSSSEDEDSSSSRSSSGN